MTRVGINSCNFCHNLVEVRVKSSLVTVSVFCDSKQETNQRKEEQSVSFPPSTLIEITDSQGFFLARFSPPRSKPYNMQACESTEYFKPQDEQTKGEEEKGELI